MEKIIITTRNFELTEALKDYINTKIGKILGFDDGILRINLVLAFSNHKSNENNFKIESIVEIPGNDIVVKVSGDDMYKLIDTLEEKLLRQIRKSHRKEKTLRHD